MSYTITFKNQAVDPIAKAPINVAVGTADSTSTSLTLTGKGAPNYGTIQQTNLIRLLENFADAVEPNAPTIGQEWYDSANLTLKVCVDTGPTVWKSLGGLQVTDIGFPPPAPAALGDLWFERTGSASGFLYVFTGIGRYPTTSTTIGGWEQIWPSVETFGGREEYDLVRQLLDQVAGPGVSGYGSGAIGRSVSNLTDFASLDKDLRTKYQALLPNDTNILYSPNTGIAVDRDITRQAESTTLYYFNDSNTSDDGFIGGVVAGVPTPSAPGTIMVNGVVTAVPSGFLNHSFLVDDAYIMWDSTNALLPANGPFFVVQQLPANAFGQWQYDDGVAQAWVSFTPTATMYIIGTISTFQAENNTIYPGDRAAFIWAHAIKLVGTKVEHLKVEPNSNDWDTLLAASKYAVNRLELPLGFTKNVSGMPFVADGRPLPASLIGLDSTSDVRYPTAARRSNRKAAAVTLVQGFTETVNALNTALANRFSLKGVNGASGTNTAFDANVVTTTHCAPPSPGLQAVVAGGVGDVRIQFRFGSMDEMTRFLGAGSALQFELTHVGGATAGDTNFRTLLSSAGNWRVTADRTRIFGQSLPLTITQPIVPNGLWNANTGGKQLNTITIGPATVAITVYRLSNTQFDVYVQFNAGSGLAGTTSLTVKMIHDGETYLPGPTAVYPTPLAFVVGDVVNPM